MATNGNLWRLMKTGDFQAFLESYDKTDIAEKFTAFFHMGRQIFKNVQKICKNLQKKFAEIFFNFPKKVAIYGSFGDLWR